MNNTTDANVDVWNDMPIKEPESTYWHFACNTVPLTSVYNNKIKQLVMPP
jgi:hypothetical protein